MYHFADEVGPVGVSPSKAIDSGGTEPSRLPVVYRLVRIFSVRRILFGFCAPEHKPYYVSHTFALLACIQVGRTIQDFFFSCVGVSQASLRVIRREKGCKLLERKGRLSCERLGRQPELKRKKRGLGKIWRLLHLRIVAGLDEHSLTAMMMTELNLCNCTAC